MEVMGSNESISIGYGGIAIVSKATGFSRPTILKGMKELNHNDYHSDRTFRDGSVWNYLMVKMPDIAMK